jgi:hypothetical protein
MTDCRCTFVYVKETKICIQCSCTFKFAGARLNFAGARFNFAGAHLYPSRKPNICSDMPKFDYFLLNRRMYVPRISCYVGVHRWYIHACVYVHLLSYIYTYVCAPLPEEYSMSYWYA